jgi:hypothetical protein
VLCECVAHICNQARLVLFPHLALPLRIGAAVADVFILARVDRLRDVRRIIEHGGVDEVACRQPELIEQVEQAPDSHAVSIVPPGECARVGRRSLHRHRMTKPRPEREVLDIDAEINGKAFASGQS